MVNMSAKLGKASRCEAEVVVLWCDGGLRRDDATAFCFSL